MQNTVKSGLFLYLCKVLKASFISKLNIRQLELMYSR